MFATQWAWVTVYVSALVLWLTGTGTGLRMSLRNPQPERRTGSRINAKFLDDPDLRGDGWIAVEDGSVHMVGWTVRHWWVPLGVVLIVAHVAWSLGVVGGNSWTDFLLPLGAAHAAARRRSWRVLTAGDLESADFLRGSVVLNRRAGSPIRLTLRESRAVELAVWLREAGVDVRTPAEPNPNRPSPPPDLDATLARLRETNERLASR